MKGLFTTLLSVTVAFALTATQVVPASVPVAAGEITTEQLRAHMAFLADDLLEGRETGTRGYDIAARYVAAQFQQLGLAPIDGSYLQELSIRRVRVDEHLTSLVLVRNGRRESLRYGRDFVTYGNADNANASVSGPLLFVGDGVTSRAKGLMRIRGETPWGSWSSRFLGRLIRSRRANDPILKTPRPRQPTRRLMARRRCYSSPKSIFRGSFASVPRDNWGPVAGYPGGNRSA